MLWCGPMHNRRMGQRLLLVLLLPPTSFSVRFFEPPIIVLYASTPPNECVVAKYFRISLQYVRCPCNTMFLRTIEYSSLDRLHEMKEHKVTHTHTNMYAYSDQRHADNPQFAVHRCIAKTSLFVYCLSLLGIFTIDRETDWAMLELKHVCVCVWERIYSGSSCNVIRHQTDEAFGRIADKKAAK